MSELLTPPQPSVRNKDLVHQKDFCERSIDIQIMIGVDDSTYSDLAIPAIFVCLQIGESNLKKQTVYAI